MPKLYPYECQERLVDVFSTGDDVTVDLEQDLLTNHSTGESMGHKLACELCADACMRRSMTLECLILEKARRVTLTARCQYSMKRSVMATLAGNGETRHIADSDGIQSRYKRSGVFCLLRIYYSFRVDRRRLLVSSKMNQRSIVCLPHDLHMTWKRA